jgi:predicted transcriptional regulator/transcriptional regulator with XRE-family HTH domain
MAGEKIFIGPKLRELRQSRKLTQAEMAGELSVSASYINLIERNQRPASLKFLITLSDQFGLNWRDLTNTDSDIAISDLRQITRDPAFGDLDPDIEELRSALEGSPNLMTGLINIFNAYRTFGERLAEQNEFMSPDHGSTLGIEQSVHDFFRSNNNYFNAIEECADKCRKACIREREDVFGGLKKHLMHTLNVDVKIVRDEILGSSLRYYDREKRQLLLSDGLDHQNRIFQLAHMVAMIEFINTLNRQLPKTIFENEVASSRCRVELANYFASAVLMPYEDFYEEALRTKYDIDRLAAIFSVSYEQVCHRLTTLQKPGKRGVPFFFLRIDRGGNVSKRFNVTPIQLARFGGACPKLDVHYCFRVPGRILTQVVEMPDHSRYMTVNRTVDRPSIRFSTEDKRLAISLGCPVEYAPELVYGSLQDSVSTQAATEVGVNCRLCPRRNCQQRAHDPFHTNLKIDEDRRGLTHFESGA